MDTSQTDKPETLTFPGRYDSLAAIDEFVSQAAEAAGLDERAVYAVQLATDEAFSNIIKHAYGGEGRGVVECTCRVDDDRLIVTLRDYGRRFDPTSVPEPDLDSDLEDRDIGGLGLYFVRKLMDEVCFEFIPGSGNSLTMVKRKETSS